MTRSFLILFSIFTNVLNSLKLLQETSPSSSAQLQFTDSTFPPTEASVGINFNDFIQNRIKFSRATPSTSAIPKKSGEWISVAPVFSLINSLGRESLLYIKIIM
jgi:hypothetical protein